MAESRIAVETTWHLNDLRDALHELEAGEAGNDAHYRAIKSAISAVQWLLIEKRNATRVTVTVTAN